MSVSGQYYSLQRVEKGDIVQLVFDQKDFVMRVYERGVPGSTIDKLSGTLQIEMFGNDLYILRQPITGEIVIEKYLDNVLIWSRSVFAFNFFSSSIAVSEGGVYLLTRADGVIQLPGGGSVQQGPGWVLIRISSEGHVIATTAITGATDIQVTDNNGEGNAVIFGNATQPLVMNRQTVIDKTTLYSFAIFVSPTLGPSDILVVDDIVVTKLAAGFNSIIHIEKDGTDNTLIFNGATGDMWTAELGDVEVQELEVYSGFVAVVVKDNTSLKWFLSQYSLAGELISKIDLPIEGDILTTQLAFNEARFLLYAISSIEGGRLLTEYDGFEDTLVWSVSVPNDTNMVAGVVEKVAVHYSNTVRNFVKRLPALVGAVSQVLWPGGTGTTGCPPGFNPCSCPTGNTGCIPPGCCPIHILPNGQAPSVVIVDFLLTSAFAPVIPGQEYFLDIQRKLTTVELPKRYIGTALDDTKVLMIQTGNLAS